MPNLAGKVCLVTGASRGIGKGIALQLITYGATCYITGRKNSTLQEVAKEAGLRGSTGKCIPVQCDHSNDEDIEKLFKKISDEQDGKLDLLVNNAYTAVNYLFENKTSCFWDLSTDSWDVVNHVGLRNHFHCAVYASRLMVPRRKGLIINISSPGGKIYFINPQYGVGKAAKDRMAKDCAADLEKYNVAFISLWPGAVRTELVQDMLNNDDKAAKQGAWMFEHGETSEFAGKCIAYLLGDENVIKRTGNILITTDIADEFGFNDIDGTRPLSQRSIKFMMSVVPAIRDYIPEWLKLPGWLHNLMLTMAKLPGRKSPSKYE